MAKTTDESLAGVDDFPRDREDVRYFIKHTGCHHRAAFRLNDNPAWFDCITFQYAETARKIPKQGLQQALEYLPHLAKSLEIGRTYRILKLRYRAVLSALDHVRVGMVVAFASGELIVVNTSADNLIRSGDGIRRDARGQLRFLNRNSDDTYNAALLQIANTATGNGRSNCVTLLAPHVSSASPLLVELAPLRDTFEELGRNASGVLITIIDPNSPDGVDIKPLAIHVGLTRAESIVCQRFVRGYTREQIAIERGVSPNTVKSQIAAIFRKSQVDTRAGLVWLAARLSPPVGPMQIDPPEREYPGSHH